MTRARDLSNVGDQELRGIPKEHFPIDLLAILIKLACENALSPDSMQSMVEAANTGEEVNELKLPKVAIPMRV